MGKTTHGESRLRIRKIYFGMIGRCHDPRVRTFKNYGAKGISVCGEWKNDYKAFKKWAMENGYSDELTIDRFPNQSGNYEPGNCRWATYKEQGRNVRTNRIFTINGISKNLTAWAEDYGIRQQTVRTRVFKGWDPLRALTEPVNYNKIGKKYRHVD